MKQRISALIDGHDESSGSFDEAIAAVAHSEESRRTWSTYSLIGDVLRGEEALDIDLVDSVMARLEHEPTVLSPVRTVKREGVSASWQRMLPIAASVMGMAAVGWVALQMNQREAAPMLAASAPPATFVQPVAANSLVTERLSRDTALRAYVMAHQGTADSTLPGVVPYVRTVAEMPQARR